MPNTPTIPKRETCALCHKVIRVGFWVPNEVWDEVVHPHYHNSIHCIECFTVRADEKLVPWDKGIKFYAISMRTHIKGCGLMGNLEPTKIGLWEETGESTPEKRATLRDALRALQMIKKTPFGCPMCDSGVLRNPAKEHWDDCGYGLAQHILSLEEN